ncbi:IS630 family transposase, partial [Paludisphaera soli]|uniref:IS630 family transposase n=1 Tax=Paludisphaera soli TaxID=2712865 RepID=UPI001F0EFBC0
MSGEFSWRLEDALSLYAEPYDPARPVVCLDEARKELHAEVREPIPAVPGRPARRDYEHARCGTANIFTAVEPLAGVRRLTVTERRGTADFAEQMRRLCDERYPEAAVIRVVLDNLNTHGPQSLFAAYPPEDAWRLARRLEFHFTPKHASWLNMAECEPSVLCRQCLSRRIADAATLAGELTAWERCRNAARARIDWTFRPADARVKLAHLYPAKPQETSVSH